MSEAARKDDDLTAEERAQIRALLKLLRRAAAAEVDAPKPAAVVPKPVDDFDEVAYVRKLKRRKGIR